jgi:hypothetical protein
VSILTLRLFRDLPFALDESSRRFQVIVSKGTYANGWIYAIHLGFQYVSYLPYLSTIDVQTDVNFDFFV